MLEWYRLGFDASSLMEEVGEFVDALLGPACYERQTYAGLIASRFGVDANADDDACLRTARDLGLGCGAQVEEALDVMLAEAIASTRMRRLFITDFPRRLAALARVGAAGTASRFELVLDGVEVANGYHELCDVDELEDRMAADIRRRRAAGGRKVDADRRLLAAQRHGLPECAGVAIGFDRLVALRLGVANLGEVIAFDWKTA